MLTSQQSNTRDSSTLPRHCSCRTGGNAAIYQQCLTGNVSAGIGGQKNDGAFEIRRLARALEWNTIAKILDPFLVLIHNRILGRLEPAGRKAVDCDTVDSPIVRQAHGAEHQSARHVFRFAGRRAPHGFQEVWPHH